MGLAEDIARLREGAVIDYDMQTWTVTEHRTYDDSRWPVDEWTLKSGTDVRFLEHDYDGDDHFRLFVHADITDVTIDGRPFLSAVPDEEAPGTITYQGAEYVLAEDDVRIDTSPSVIAKDLTRSEEDRALVGVCAGIGEYADISSSLVRVGFVVGTFATNVVVPCLCMPLPVAFYGLLAFAMPEVDHSTPERDLSHYWMYRRDDDYVVLECGEGNDWSVYAGRDADPHEFSNVLPGPSSD